MILILLLLSVIARAQNTNALDVRPKANGSALGVVCFYELPANGGNKTCLKGPVKQASDKAFDIETLNGGVVNVRDYGALGDGVQDDRAAIQQAIDVAAGSRAMVLLPPGQYLVLDSLIMRTNTYLKCNGSHVGAGADGVQIKATAPWGGGIAVIRNDPSTRAWNSGIEGCRITGMGSNSTGPLYGLYYNYGNGLNLSHMLIEQTRRAGLFLDNDGTGAPDEISFASNMNDVVVWDNMLETPVSTRMGSLQLQWSDVYIQNSGFYGGVGGAVADYSQGGNRISCYFMVGANNGQMVNTECSWAEVGMRVDTSNWKISASRVQFNAGDGVQVPGYWNSFSAFQAQWNGRYLAGGPFYHFNVTGPGNTFGNTVSNTECPGNGSTGTVPYAFIFNVAGAYVNRVNGHVGPGCQAPFLATTPQARALVEWSIADPDLLRRVGSGQVLYYSRTTGFETSPHKLMVDDTSGNDVFLGVGAPPSISITSATAANPSVLTLASVAPSDWTVGRYVVITGAYSRAGATDPCGYLNGRHYIQAVSGSSVSIGFDNSGCSGYITGSGSAVLSPTESITVNRAGGPSDGSVASLGLRGRVAWDIMQDKRAASCLEGTWRRYTNNDEAGHSFDQLVYAAIDCAETAEARYMLVSRLIGSLAIKYVAFPGGYTVVGDSVGDASASGGKLQVYSGTIQSGGVAFSSLPANGQHVTWCTNCQTTNPCTSGGGGAWAFRFSSGTWNCSLGSAASIPDPLTVSELRTNLLTLDPGGSSVKVLSGSSSPEGSVSAAGGSIFLRTSGGASTTLYAKTSGTGSAGWSAFYPVPAPGSSGTVLTSDGTSGYWATPSGGLPSQSGQSGKWLNTNGSTASWNLIQVADVRATGSAANLLPMTNASQQLQLYTGADVANLLKTFLTHTHSVSGSSTGTPIW